MNPQACDVHSNRDMLLSGLMVLIAVVLSFAIMVVGYYAPPERGELAVIFPPWFSEIAAIESIMAAGGAIVGRGKFDNVIIAFASDSEFAGRVFEHGAWFLASARGLCALA